MRFLFQIFVGIVMLFGMLLVCSALTTNRYNCTPAASCIR